MEEINFPPDVRKILFVLIGEMPLQARENLLYASRELYSYYGKNLTKLRDTARETIQKSRDSLPPAVAEQYVQGLTMLIGEGRGNDPVQRVLDQITDLENRQIDLSQNVQGAKWEIIAEIIMLIAELAILTALMAFTGGASVSQIFLARARSRFAVLMIIDRLLTMTHIMPTLTEAVTEALQTLAVRLAQIALNSGRRKPDGIDWGDVGKAAAFGAVVGFFGSVFEWVAKPFKSIFKDLNADVLDKFKFNPNDLTYKFLRNGPPEVVGAFVIAGAAEGLGEYIVTGAFEGNWDFKWETFVGSGSSAVFELGASVALGGAGLWAYNKYFDNKDTFTEINDLSGSGGGAGTSSGSGPGSVNSGGDYGGSGPTSVVTSSPPVLPGPLPSSTTSSTSSRTTPNSTFTPTPSPTTSVTAPLPSSPTASSRTYNPPSDATTSPYRSDPTVTPIDYPVPSSPASSDIESVLNPASPLPTTSTVTGDLGDTSGLTPPKSSVPLPGSTGTDTAATPTDLDDSESVGSDTSSSDPKTITPASPVSTGTGPSHTPGIGTGGAARQPAPEAVTEARDEHAEARRAVTEAQGRADTIRQRVEAGVGSSRDADALTRATEDVRQAETHLMETEERLREWGIDPYAPDQHTGQVPVVRRDEAQRHWIADRITVADLPAEPGDVTDPSDPTVLDQVKSLMVQPGPWSPELDTTAANATRRIWQEAYVDFADAVPDETRDNAGQAWSTAVSLVLPLELHPVLADSRHALESYQSAVRQVADVLVTGGGREAATTLADRLRHGLDLPARLRGGADGGVPAPPTAVPTAGEGGSRSGPQPFASDGESSDADDESSDSAASEDESDLDDDSDDEPIAAPPHRPPTASAPAPALAPTPAHDPDPDSEDETSSESESHSEADSDEESDSDDDGLVAAPEARPTTVAATAEDSASESEEDSDDDDSDDDDSDDDGLAGPEDLERLRYQSEAEEYERRLADFLSEHPDVTAEVKRFVALLWEKTPPLLRPMLGSLDNSVPGSVGRSLSALEQVVENGNFREQTVLLWNALRYHVFDNLQKTRKTYPPLIEADRRWRGAPSDGPTPQRDPNSLRPPLSQAERDFSAGGSAWTTGAERSGISHRPPAPLPTDERPLTVEDSPHYAAQSTGALLMTGLSGTAYFWLNAVEAANTQWEAGLDLGLMRLALIGTLLGNRHHSLHEVLKAAELWASEDDHPERHDLDFGYDDSWDRYNRLEPLSEQDLRDHVAVGGRFPNERVREFYQGGTSGRPPRSAVPRLSNLLLQGSWWRLFIDPNVHDEVFAPQPEDIGGHLDRTKYPGYRKGMTELYAEVLDGGSGDRDWTRVDVAAYEEMHDLATRHLTDGGQNRSTTWSGSSMVTHRGTGVERLAADVGEETVLGRPLLVDFNAQQPGGPRPMMVFWLGGRVSSNYTVEDARNAVQELLDRYYDEVAVAVSPDDKLRAIARVARALQVLQPFTDANSRVNVHTLMQKFLLEQGFRPAVLMNSHSLFLGGFSVPEIVAHLKDGMELFDQHLRWARWDGFNQFGGPRDIHLLDGLAQGMGLTGDSPGELRRRVVDTVRTARAMFGDEIPGNDQAGQASWLGAFQRLRDTAGTLFPELSGPDAISEYVSRVYELGPEDDLFDEHVLATVESVGSLPADGGPLDMDAVREHLPELADDAAQSEADGAAAETDDDSEDNSEDDSDSESDEDSDSGSDQDSDSDDDSDSPSAAPPLPLPQTAYVPSAPAGSTRTAPEPRAPAAEAPLLLPSMAFDPHAGADGRRRGGLRGGSRDNGVDPLASGWPVGRSVTLMAPRRAPEGETGPAVVPVGNVPVPEGKGKNTPEETWFPITLREPSDPDDSVSVRSGSSAATPLGYEVSDTGRVRLPDGVELTAEGWVGFGDDFVHLPSGAYLRGDSGWIGRVENIDALRDVLDELDPETAAYSLVADRSKGVFLTPEGEGSQAVHLPLDLPGERTAPQQAEEAVDTAPAPVATTTPQAMRDTPVLDAALPAPSARRRTPAQLDAGRTMPAYVDDLEALLPSDLTDDERRQLLDSPSTFGQSTVALRGIAQVVDRIRSELGRRPGARPRDQDQLSADITRLLTQKPKTLTDRGRPLPYPNEDGRLRVLHIRTRHHGNWTPYDDGIGHASKIDSMHRAAAVFGFTKNMQANSQYGLGGPLGPVGAAAFGGYGRLAFRFGFIDKVGYTLTDQRQNQMETRTLDDSRTYLDDLHYELWVTDATGQIVTGRDTETDPGTETDSDTDTHTGTDDSENAQVVPVRFEFGVRNGLQVRLPDSVTKVSRPGRIPRSIDLGRDSQYRFVRVEGYGPVAVIRDWAARLIGAVPGSTAYDELDTFFSGDSFQRHSATMARGRITTPPLFADDKNKSPLGVFVVEEVVPRTAVLFGETDKAEMRDINTSTVRSERSRAQGTSVLLQAAAGPAFNFFEPGLAPFDLRLQFGPNAQYSFARNRQGGLGGAGSLKSAGQVKGLRTALYVVVKSVRVRRAGDSGPPAQFLTWSLDRMTSSEARRLAGWDDGTSLVLRHGAVPFAPAYLTVDRPRTLGMHRVKEFAFDDGRRTRLLPDAADGVGRTLLDAFADSVVNAVAARRRGLVVPLDQLNLPKGWRARFHDMMRRDPGGVLDAAKSLPVPPHWSDPVKYHAALQNTLQILGVLSQQSVTAGLEALTTVGLGIRLTDPGSVGQTYYTVWVHGTLTGRRYEGKDLNEGMRFSAQGVERMDGQTSAKRGVDLGFEGTLSGRDNNVDDAGLPRNTLGLTLGARKGWQREAESGFGSTVTNEPMSVSNQPTHLYRYDLELTATLGGYWRPRGLIRGLGFGLPGLLVLDEPTDILFGRTAQGLLRGGGPVTGQVLISVPVQHTPEADPHADGALNPYLTDEPALVTMSTERALALAKGDLMLPDDSGRGTERLSGRGTDQFRELGRHPYVIVNVVLSPQLVAEANRVLRRASGSAWQLVKEGAPTREAITRVFTPQYLTANFDQSSGPLGLTGSGLLGKGPAAELWGTFRYATTVSGLTMLTGSMAMDTEMILGGTRQASGKVSNTTTFVFGGQLGYNAARDPGHGLLSVYGLVANPVSRSRAHGSNIVRTVVADMNRKGFTHQVLVAGDVQHWFALTTSRLGTGRFGRAAAGSSLVPSALAGTAGTEVATPAGLLAHLPEKSAYRMGLIDDGLGDVPRYTQHLWAPQPWLLGAPFGTYAVNSLDPTAALLAFERRLDGLGLDEPSREKIRQLVTARATRALKGEMATTGPSTMVAVKGSGWGSVRIGTRWVRVRVELVAGTPEFHGLDHSVEMEENRRAIEAVQKNSEASSGADLALQTSQLVHTGNASVAGAGPTYTEGGSSKRTVSSSHTTTTVTIYRAASTEPHAEIVTPYTMRITLEADDTPNSGGGTGRTAEDGTTTALDRFRGRRRIVEEHAVGGLREHVPLSLMEPAPATPAAAPSGTVVLGSRKALPAPDPGSDPALARAPRPTPVPPVRREVTVVYGDGVRRPFTFPENGFHPRAVIGVENIRAANDLLLTRSYDGGFSLTALESTDGPDAATLTALLRTTRTTGLTRLGTGSAQALEDGTSHMAVTAFYPRTLEPEGYRIAGLTEKSFLGTDDGELSLHSTPDFSRALLLTVADGKKLEVLRRHGENAGTSSAGEHTQGGNLGGGFLYDSPSGVGLNQIGLFGPGPNALDGDGMPVGDDHLTSRNLKPKTGRTFLFAIPTTFVGVGDVHRTFRDSKAVTVLRGTFGHVRPGPQAMESEAYVVAWVREDVARELLLITDENFPTSVGTSWDAVGKASKGWVDADQAYWKKRRTAIHLRDAVRTAESAANEARNRLNPLLDAAEAADAALEQAAADAATARDAARDLDRAADALDTAEARLKTARDTARADRATAAALVTTAQETLDMLPGWAELPGNELAPDQLDQATADLAAARRRADELRDAADRAVGTARRERDEAADRLAALEQAAHGRTTPLTPAADAARARQTADTRREAAARRVAGARTRQTAAARRLDQPARAETAATERLQAARDAFESRRQDLERLRAAADTAAAEYHRVRAATDQLTRWHRLAATTDGRRQLDGLQEPPAVTYQAPPKPTTPPPPERPRYTRTVTEEHTVLTAPGGRQAYVLSEVDHDGDAFFHALLHGLDGVAPELLAAAGIDAASPDAVPQLRRRLAARLTDPADVDLLTFVTPDETDSFTAREVSDAGLDLGTDTPVRREFEALGVIPHAADLSAEARAGLAVAQLLRRGDADSERGWNHSAADLLPMLAARTFGVRITVVRADGTFDHFDPASATAGRGLRGLTDDAGVPRPHVVLSLADRHYQPARPLGLPPVTEAETARTTTAVPPVTDEDTAARTSTGGGSTSVVPSAPPGGSQRRVDTGDRSFTVRPVAGDGDCLFHAVLDSMAAQQPGRQAPGSAATLPQVRGDLARWYTESADAAAFRALHAAQDPVETLVADLFPGLTALQDLLGHNEPPVLTDEQRDRIRRQLSLDGRRADLGALAADDQERELLSGFPAAAVAELLPAAPTDPWQAEPDRARSLTRRAQADTLRAEVLRLLRAPAGDARADAVWRRIRSSLPPESRAHIPADRRAFTTIGYGALVARSLASSALWHTPFYDDAPALLAHRLGVRLVLVQPAADGGHTVVDLAPDVTGPVVYVHYNGRDHYEALIPAEPAPTGTAPGPRPEREDRPTPPPALSAQDVETRDRLAGLLRRHGADEADAARLTAGLSAATLARLRAAAHDSGALAATADGPSEPEKPTEHTVAADEESRPAAPPTPLWSEGGVLTLGGTPLHLHEIPGEGEREGEGEGERFTEALVHALRADPAQLTQGDAELVAALSAPGGPDAVHRWVEQRLATPDAADRAPLLADPGWLGGRQELSTTDLMKAGVALNAEQRVFVELGGTGLPVAEIDLSLPERYRLLRQSGDGGRVTDVVAELLSEELGVRLTIIEQDGGVRQFGPVYGPAIVLARTDGVYRAATAPTPL